MQFYNICLRIPTRGLRKESTYQKEFLNNMKVSCKFKIWIDMYSPLLFVTSLLSVISIFMNIFDNNAKNDIGTM